MKKSLRISLRAGERIYVNGAVLRADRKVSLEFLNEVSFLLEGHVIHADETTTPLRQLYFIVQTMLMDPGSAPATRDIFEASYARLCHSVDNEEMRAGLEDAHDLVAANRIFDALKAIRTLLPLEATILGAGEPDGNPLLETA